MAAGRPKEKSKRRILGRAPLIGLLRRKVGKWAPGLQYNHRMMYFLKLQLDRVKQLGKPPGTLDKEWECFNLAVQKGRRLLAKHEGSFDIRTFYKIEDVRSAVDKTCQYLKQQIQDWQLGIGNKMEGRIPQDWVDEDKKYLHGLLAYILKGVEDGVDDAALLRWLPIKWRHEEEMDHLQIIGEDLLVLGRKIGEGGYGVVYEAQWNLARVAVKTPRRVGDLPIEEFASLIKEVLVHGKLSHPNIAQVFATTPSGWLVMQAADTDLGTICHQGMRLDWCGTLYLLQEAAKGLCYLHCLSPPVVHSDVKPSNFLVYGKEISSCGVKVTDFGCAFEMLEGNSKSARLGGGTLEWLAPEIYHNKPISILSDVFSFGVIMYEVVTGAYPYGADQLSHYAKEAVIMNKKLSGEEPCMVAPEDCPEEMHAFMRRCCSIDPGERPTMLEVCKYLEQLPKTWRLTSQQSDEEKNSLEKELAENELRDKLEGQLEGLPSFSLEHEGVEGVGHVNVVVRLGKENKRLERQLEEDRRESAAVEEALGGLYELSSEAECMEGSRDEHLPGYLSDFMVHNTNRVREGTQALSFCGCASPPGALVGRDGVVGEPGTSDTTTGKEAGGDSPPGTLAGRSGAVGEPGTSEMPKSKEVEGGKSGTLAQQWIEVVVPGVSAIFEREPGGVTKIKKLRFQKRKFTAESAQNWMQENKQWLLQRKESSRTGKG